MIKYSVGLDVSSKTIHACLCVIDIAQKVTIKSSCKIDNTVSGFKHLEQWMKKHMKVNDVPLVIVMEATGVYHENCALFLFSKGYNISVVLPNKAKKWLQSDGVKSKNDKIDAAGLSRMGAEKSLEIWQPAAEFYYQLRSLTRQCQSLHEHRTVYSNQMHAEENGMYKNKIVINQIKRSIALIDKQIAELTKEIEAHIYSNIEVAEKVKNICTIKGVGILTVAVLLAETNGFILFKNAPQLVSYAGYDITENQSGNHVGKTRISKKGNSRIRRAMHMPAFSVITHKVNPFLALFNRTYEKHKIKMKSYVAVQKKLLVVIYSLWKQNAPFNPNHYNNFTKEQESVRPLSSALAEMAMHTPKYKNSPTEAGLHKVNTPSELSPYASSQRKQSYLLEPNKQENNF